MGAKNINSVRAKKTGLAAELEEELRRAASGPGSVAAVAESHPADQEAEVLERLLKMADRYCAENALRQAIEIYLELAEVHEGTPEARKALERLMRIAEQYECTGERRQARGIYERLLVG